MSDKPSNALDNESTEQPLEPNFTALSDDRLENVTGGIRQYEIEIVETDVRLFKRFGISIGQAWRSKKTGMEEGKCNWTEEMLDYMRDHWFEIN